MKEKIKAFFKDERVKRFTRKVLNKKTFVTAIVILVVVLALKVSFSLMFQIEGVVKNVDGKNITVANFFTTKTVNVGDYPIESKQIQVGDKIEITKNLSGDVLYVRDGDKGHMKEKGNISEGGKQKSREDGKNNHKEKN